MGSSAGGCFLPGDPPPITGAIGGGAGSPTTASFVNTLTASSYAASTHQDEVLSQVTLSPTTTVTAANGLNAIRGEVGLPSGKTLGSGSASYVTSVYGRGNIFGTVNIGSGDLAAVYAKFDCNGSTLTSGHIAPLQSNIVNPPAASSNLDLIYAESASGTAINSILKAFAAATYFCDLTDVGATYIVTGAVGGSQSKKLKCNIGGTTFYIPLNTA